jgi:type IV pilus assembly protein PilC
MATYTYSAVDHSGNRLTGTLEVGCRDDVVRFLQEKNLIITKITDSSTVINRKKSIIPSIPRSINTSDIMIFTRELATMINAGLPIVESLYVLSEDIENPTLQSAVRDLGSSVIGGMHLSEAMEKHPRIFNSLYVNLIRVGERSGGFEKIMNHLADYLEASEVIRKRVQSSMYYPIAILVFAALIVTVLFVLVVPRFAEIYKDFQQTLPPITVFFFNLSTFMERWFPLMTGLSLVLVLVLQMLTRKGPGKLLFDTIKLKVPVFGSLVRKIVVARFSRTLALLYANGIPILESLELVARSSGNKRVENAILSAGEEVMEGSRITDTLVKSGLFPNMVIHMIDVGERTGQLPDMLNKIAEFYDVQVRTAIEGLIPLIEPVLLVFLGAMVAFIAVAMLLPIFQLPNMIK